GEGWTIYIWLISGVAIVIAAIIGIIWAAKNRQFDEDIKYLVFDEGDKDRMDPKEYKKSREVLAEQMKLRDEFLEKERQERENRRA
ncbi:MAG: hypothetical protein Q9M27_03145, partial [Mariprofundaceae bacterium]|nr:hypothetical protein [Mariprofundaceae bacterium]